MKDTAKGGKDIDINELIAAEAELAALKKEHGVKEQEGKVSRAVSAFFERREAREEVLLSKKKYLILALLTGWMGGHRFYAKQYPVAILYLLFFWSGFPVAMTIIDLLVVIPKEADEQGNIRI